MSETLRTLVEIILSTPRVFLSGCCKARFAGNSGTIPQKRNAAAAAQEQPDVKIISTRVLSPTGRLPHSQLYPAAFRERRVLTIPDHDMVDDPHIDEA